MLRPVVAATLTVANGLSGFPGVQQISRSRRSATKANKVRNVVVDTAKKSMATMARKRLDRNPFSLRDLLPATQAIF